jgi:hypothetical protein
MKAKYLIIVSLLLAVLTIGAVSASDDVAVDDAVAANDDRGDKIVTVNDDAIQDSGDDKVSAEDGNVLEDVDANDFDAEMVTDEIDLDDEGYDDETVFSFYCPNGTAGNRVYTVYEDDEGYDCEGDYVFIDSDDIGTYKTITFSDLRIYDMGLYDLKLYYSYYDNDEHGLVQLMIASGHLSVFKTISDDDFTYSPNGDYNYNAYDNDGPIFDLWRVPCEGTLIIDVDGTQVYSEPVPKDLDEFLVYVNDLGITDYDTYNILAKFQPVIGDEVNITSFNLKYYYDDYRGDGGDYDEDGVTVYNYVDLTDSQDTLGRVSDYPNIVGTVTVSINNKQVYSKTFTAANNKYDLSFTVADLNLASYARGKYNVKITYQKAGEPLQSDEKLVNFTVLPKIGWPYEMMVGENTGLSITGPKGISGSATIYNAVYDEDSGEYKKGTVFATVPIVDGSAWYSFAKLTEGGHIFLLDYTYGDYKHVSDGYDEDYYSVHVYKKDTRYTSSISSSSILVGQNVAVTLKGPASSHDTVIIKVDGLNVKQITGFSGSLNEIVSGLTAGTHHVTVMISGDSYYSNTFEVKVNTPAPAKVKKATKIVAKKATFKAKKKVKRYTITLKSGKAAVKKVIVTLKVKGKTYKAKTNKKGKAVFKIKNLKKKGK